MDLVIFYINFLLDTFTSIFDQWFAFDILESNDPTNLWTSDPAFVPSLSESFKGKGGFFPSSAPNGKVPNFSEAFKAGFFPSSVPNANAPNLSEAVKGKGGFFPSSVPNANAPVVIVDAKGFCEEAVNAGVIGTYERPVFTRNISLYDNFIWSKPFWVITADNKRFFVKGDGLSPIEVVDHWVFNVGTRFELSFSVDFDGVLDVSSAATRARIEEDLAFEKKFFRGSFIREPGGPVASKSFVQWCDANKNLITVVSIFVGLGIALFFHYSDMPPRHMNWEPK